MQLVKGDLIRLIGPISLYLGEVAYFEEFWDRRTTSGRSTRALLKKGCNISLYKGPVDLSRKPEKADMFVFYHEYFPIGSKE